MEIYDKRIAFSANYETNAFYFFSQFMQNLFVRFSIRLIPNSLRAIIYTKLIR